MVPYVVYLTIVPVTLLCIVVSLDGGAPAFWTLWGECMAVYAVVQLTADYYITPRVMSKSMNLDPAVILLSLSVWGDSSRRDSGAAPYHRGISLLPAPHPRRKRCQIGISELGNVL